MCLNSGSDITSLPLTTWRMLFRWEDEEKWNAICWWCLCSSLSSHRNPEKTVIILRPRRTYFNKFSNVSLAVVVYEMSERKKNISGEIWKSFACVHCASSVSLLCAVTEHFSGWLRLSISTTTHKKKSSTRNRQCKKAVGWRGRSRFLCHLSSPSFFRIATLMMDENGDENNAWKLFTKINRARLLCFSLSPVFFGKRGVSW